MSHIAKASPIVLRCPRPRLHSRVPYSGSFRGMQQRSSLTGEMSVFGPQCFYQSGQHEDQQHCTSRQNCARALSCILLHIAGYTLDSLHMSKLHQVCTIAPHSCTYRKKPACWPNAHQCAPAELVAARYAVAALRLSNETDGSKVGRTI